MTNDDRYSKIVYPVDNYTYRGNAFYKIPDKSFTGCVI